MSLKKGWVRTIARINKGNIWLNIPINFLKFSAYMVLLRQVQITDLLLSGAIIIFFYIIGHIDLSGIKIHQEEQTYNAEISPPMTQILKDLKELKEMHKPPS